MWISIESAFVVLAIAGIFGYATAKHEEGIRGTAPYLLVLLLLFSVVALAASFAREIGALIILSIGLWFLFLISEAVWGYIRRNWSEGLEIKNFLWYLAGGIPIAVVILISHLDLF